MSSGIVRGGRAQVKPQDATSTSSITDRYQVGGFAAQSLIGLKIDMVRWLSLCIETKLSYADIDGDLTDRGSIAVRPWTIM